ncbi:DUF3800 domain-containing protein [Cryobacterium zongtaii]|uniref:DUF3800 domain-containing protein n=1 Tax=Cryobacterium zongtaii TaxID=1259217 RepID=UPI001A9F75D2|nr:DUF3800 domain-containing protein [Cryobacterium zongtaii]
MTAFLLNTEMVHLCYVDDSGDSKNGTTLTAVIVEDKHWSALLDAWLEGRREVHRLFGVGKNLEIHAHKLYKGRGEFCETPVQNSKFGTKQRAATGRILLTQVGRFPEVTIMTVGMKTKVNAEVYARFVARLEDWAAQQDTYLMIFYDGQQGLPAPGSTPTQLEMTELWETAIRDAKPYRDVHRSLDISTRRVVEDVIMQDSKYSQFIQAADLIAYGAFHKHAQEHPEIWGAKLVPSDAAIIAYMKTAARWPSTSDYGVEWFD